MKKILILFLFFFLVWCWSSWTNMGIEEYNNTLISFQEASVDALKNYYEGLEKNYDGSNLILLFTWTLEDLSSLESQAENISWWNDDNELRDAVVNYISWMRAAFMTYEWPVIEILVDYTGQVSRFYKDNEEVFSQSAMQLASELAILDKSLEESYIHFAENHGYKNP